MIHDLRYAQCSKRILEVRQKANPSVASWESGGRVEMNTIDKADEAQLFATIDRWVEREVAPRVKEFDHADRWPAELVEQMKELGLFGATVAQDYGGLGLPARTYAE